MLERITQSSGGIIWFSFVRLHKKNFVFPNQICTPVRSLHCSGGGSSCGRCSTEHCLDFLWQALLTSDAAGKSFLSVNSSFLGNLISCMTPCISSFEAFQYSHCPQEFPHYWLSQYISAISLLFH